MQAVETEERKLLGYLAYDMSNSHSPRSLYLNLRKPSGELVTPRVQLMRQFALTSAKPVYRDDTSGVVQLGWIVAGGWWRVGEVYSRDWSRPCT